jgi:hypothetical protein
MREGSMSAQQFDELARALAAARSRRTALKSLAQWAGRGVAITLGVAAVGAVNVPRAEAACKEFRRCDYVCTQGQKERTRCLCADNACPKIQNCDIGSDVVGYTSKQACFKG